MARLWVDDVRPAPNDYIWCNSVREAKDTILMLELYATVNENCQVELIDLDHDAGDFVNEGGDYIKLMDWLIETNRMYPLAFHSQNPVGRAAMERMYRRYWLKETI